MTDELVAYLLDDLCPDRRAEVERRLQTEPAWRAELERLEQCLAAGGEFSECCDEPPRDLVHRTCCLVDKTACSPALAPPSGDQPARIWSWSTGDCLVCSGVLLALGMLVLPAICQSRETARRIACQNNLRALGTVMLDYAHRHEGRLPQLRPGEGAGMLVMRLADLTGTPRQELASLLTCPASLEADARFNSCKKCYIPSASELQRAQGAMLVQMLQAMSGSFAFAIGNYDRWGRYREPVINGDPMQPLAADGPQMTGAGVRSINHGGWGQNVLFQDMHVSYLPDCVLGEREPIYVNDEGRLAAGKRPGDVVLVDGAHGPAGLAVTIEADGLRPAPGLKRGIHPAGR